MPEHADNEVERIFSGAIRRRQHGEPAADEGRVGTAIKTKTPAADTPRATFRRSAVGEPYNMIVHGGIISVPLAGLEAAVHGDLVYITTATNALSLNNPGAGRQVLGKVVELAGERGGPLDRLRVDLDEKVN
jgi:hypothetical protein